MTTRDIKALKAINKEVREIRKRDELSAAMKKVAKELAHAQAALDLALAEVARLRKA